MSSNRAKIAYKAQGQTFPKQGTTNYQAIRDNVITLLVEQAELDQKAASMGITVTRRRHRRAARAREEAVLRRQREEVPRRAQEAGLHARQQVRTRRDPAAAHLREGAEADHEGRQGHGRRSPEVLRRATSRPTSSPRRATSATSSSGRARRPRSRSTSSSSSGSDKTWCTLAKKYAKDASGQNCGKATFSKGQTVAIFDTTAFTAPANKVVKPFYDPTQYKAWFVIEPLGPVKPQVDDAREASGVADQDRRCSARSRRRRSRPSRRA